MTTEFTPTPDDYTLHIPITFDYNGGRGQNKKAKIIITILLSIVGLSGIIGVILSRMYLYQKLIIALAIFYVVLLFLRIVVFREIYISDLYEKQKALDYKLDITDIWQIFDIDYTYPYICYFKNGKKGIFVQMDRDAITGKPDTAAYDHYEAIGNAYNVAHQLSMDIVHIDYMDSVGNDSRFESLYNDVSLCENTDMQEILTAIYSNLENEMRANYFSYDVYLFITREKANNFFENVQQVCNTMLGGNFLTYHVMDAEAIGNLCKALFNFHEFSVNDACESVLAKRTHPGVRPLSVIDLQGNLIEEINKSVEELQEIERIEARRAAEAAEEAKQKKLDAKKKKKGKQEEVPTEDKKEDEVLDLWKQSEVSTDDKDEDEVLDLWKQSEKE